MMYVKVSRDKYSVDQENLIYVRWKNIENCAWRKGWWSLAEKEIIRLNEVKPVKSINNNLQSFLEISNMQNEVPH